MKFKIPYLTRLLEIKEEQLSIELSKEIILNEILEELKKLNIKIKWKKGFI